jgi:hypothetical protein
MNWWSFDVIDTATGHDWVLRVPYQDAASAEAYLWQLHFVTARPRPWTPQPDPTLGAPVPTTEYRIEELPKELLDPLWQKAFAEQLMAMEIPELPEETLDAVDSNRDGRVRSVTMDRESNANDLRELMDLEADPICRHFLLQRLSHLLYGYEPDHGGLETVGVCWQWFAEWPSIRACFLQESNGDRSGIPPTLTVPDLLETRLRELGFAKRARWVKLFERSMRKSQYP